LRSNASKGVSSRFQGVAESVRIVGDGGVWSAHGRTLLTESFGRDNCEGVTVKGRLRALFDGLQCGGSSSGIQTSSSPSSTNFLFDPGFFTGSAEDVEILAIGLGRVRLKTCSSIK
jgi:hypothetical protein